MFRPLSILAGFLLPLGGAAADEGPSAARALERAMQEAIKKAEPSIACILVSRSQRYARFGAAPSANEPGRLGGFDAARALFGVDRRGERARQIKALDLSDPDNTPESYGSGVVLDRSGLVLTNAHVVRGATKVFVRLPGGAGSYADIHALDCRSDLAVLRLIGKLPPLKALPLGDGDAVRKGQFVIALANPFAAGFRDGSPSASFGIVSNLRRRMPGKVDELERNRLSLHQYGLLIQTDARLQAGCSGGALLNLKGELIGLTTSLAALEGVETPGGYALPMTTSLRSIVKVLLRGEEVEYGFLGVRFRPGSGNEVCLADVIRGSGASRAGLRGGDYILSIDGKPVRDYDDVFLLVGQRLAGTTIEVERSRVAHGRGQKVLVKLAKYHVPLPSIASRRPPARGGLRVDYTSLLVQTDAGRKVIPEGVMIREVVPGSAAARAGLQPSRVILRVDGRKVTTPAEYYRAAAAARGEMELTLSNAQGPGFQQLKLRLD